MPSRHRLHRVRSFQARHRIQLTAFVPLHTNAEINRLDVTNTTDEPAVIDVTGSVEWCLWNADDDMKNFQRNLSTGEVEVQDSTIYHKTEYRERRNHYAIYSVNTKIDGFDTSRDAFLGAYRGADSPEALRTASAQTPWQAAGLPSLPIRSTWIWQPVRPRPLSSFWLHREPRRREMGILRCDQQDPCQRNAGKIPDRCTVDEALQHYRLTGNSCWHATR